MKLLSTILLWLAILLLVGQLFIWFLAYGSGHNIPKDTEMAFLRNVIILFVTIVLFYLWKRKVGK